MSPAILNAERVYLSRSVVECFREGSPSPLLRLMKFEAKAPPASRQIFEVNFALKNGRNERAKLKLGKKN